MLMQDRRGDSDAMKSLKTVPTFVFHTPENILFCLIYPTDHWLKSEKNQRSVGMGINDSGTGRPVGRPVPFWPQKSNMEVP